MRKREDSFARTPTSEGVLSDMALVSSVWRFILESRVGGSKATTEKRLAQVRELR